MAAKFALKFIIYLSCLLLLLFGLNKVAGFKQTHDSSENKWHELFNNEIQAEVIIIGASHAAAGINPKYLEHDGIRVFNFALNGNNPRATLKWYKHFFRELYPKPRAIIYEVNWFLFDSDWLGFHIENASRYFPYQVYLKELLNRDNDREMLILNRYPIFYNKISDFSVNQGERIIDVEANYYHGFTPDNGRQVNLDITRHESTRNFAEQQNAFNELLDLFKSDGIRVILVQAPEYLNGRNCDMIEKNNEYIRNVAKMKHLSFYNFNDELTTSINYDKNMYTDWGHLNMDGSAKFSRVLAETLKDQMQKSVN